MGSVKVYGPGKSLLSRLRRPAAPIPIAAVDGDDDEVVVGSLRRGYERKRAIAQPCKT